MVPSKLVVGVKVKDPLALTVADPLAGWVLEVTVRVSPSGSVSFPNTPGAATFNVVFSLVVYELLTAVGDWFGGFEIVIETVAVSDKGVASSSVTVSRTT